jgi:hypothetical protein
MRVERRVTLPRSDARSKLFFLVLVHRFLLHSLNFAHPREPAWEQRYWHEIAVTMAQQRFNCGMQSTFFMTR